MTRRSTFPIVTPTAPANSPTSPNALRGQPVSLQATMRHWDRRTIHLSQRSMRNPHEKPSTRHFPQESLGLEFSDLLVQLVPDVLEKHRCTSLGPPMVAFLPFLLCVGTPLQSQEHRPKDPIRKQKGRMMPLGKPEDDPPSTRARDTRAAFPRLATSSLRIWA